MTSRAHPDFADSPPPERATLDRFGLAPLTTQIVEEDYRVVVACAADLRGLFDPADRWPDGLSLEDNLIDLAWHEREFEARRSFAWVLREGATYAGCLYVFPRMGERGAADAWFWLRSDGPDHRGHGPAFRAALAAWFAGPDWPEVSVTMQS